MYIYVGNWNTTQRCFADVIEKTERRVINNGYLVKKRIGYFAIGTNVIFCCLKIADSSANSCDTCINECIVRSL